MWCNSMAASQDSTCMADIQSCFQALGKNLDENEISEWLDADSTDRSYSHLTDDEIIAEVTGQSNTESIASDDEDDPVIIHQVSSSASTISQGEALHMFDNCICWLQHQDEASVHNLSVLHDLRTRPYS